MRRHEGEMREFSAMGVRDVRGVRGVRGVTRRGEGGHSTARTAEDVPTAFERCKYRCVCAPGSHAHPKSGIYMKKRNISLQDGQKWGGWETRGRGPRQGSSTSLLRRQMRRKRGSENLPRPRVRTFSLNPFFT